jgi:hypothetical protein
VVGDAGVEDGQPFADPLEVDFEPFDPFAARFVVNRQYPALDGGPATA